MQRCAARLGALFLVGQILLGCASAAGPAATATTVVSTNQSTSASAPTNTAIAVSTNTPVPVGTSTEGPSTPTSAAIAPTATSAAPSTPAPDAYPSPAPPPTPQPAGAANPVPQPTTVAYPAPGATATLVPAPAALTANQIAATAIAAAAGEQCVASGPKPAKGFIGDPVRGKTLFSERGCSACHGDQAQGLVGPKLAGTTLSFGAVIQQLRQPRGVMQRYLPKDQSDADECDVYQYVKNLKS